MFYRTIFLTVIIVTAGVPGLLLERLLYSTKQKLQQQIDFMRDYNCSTVEVWRISVTTSNRKRRRKKLKIAITVKVTVKMKVMINHQY